MYSRRARILTLPQPLFAALLLSTLPVSASTNFVVPPGRQASPQTITAGPDHNLWFTEVEGEKIGRLTTSGTITLFSVAGAQSPVGIVGGPDGKMWFTDQLTGKVGHISVEGTQPVQFTLPKGSSPQGITVGPDNNLWFVDQKADGLFTIGRITVTGKITENPVGLNAGPYQEFGQYGQIAAGPDGNLWFINPQLTSAGTLLVGKITPTGEVTTYPLGDSPLGICAGPDGNLWIIEASHVAKVTTAGMETKYPLMTPGSGWTGIAPGADGNLWFTEIEGAGYVTPAGVVTEIPGSALDSLEYLVGIVSGPDGALWITNGYPSSNLARLTTAGVLTNVYPLNSGSTPAWNTTGPDGAVWFTELTGNAVGRIDVTGAETTFALPTPNAEPGGIVTGTDGNLWFVEERANQVAKVTTVGVFTEYSLGAKPQGLWGITTGSDGNVWFCEYGSNNIARITPSGVITPFAIPTPNAIALMIAPGPDANLWFSEEVASQIGKLDPFTGVIVEYPIGSGKAPGAITTGPDGNIWFLENTPSGAVGVMNASGELLAEYPVSFQNSPQGLIAAGDGALWIPQNYPGGLARISIGGVVSEVLVTVSNPASNDVAIGSDGKLWVVDAVAGEVNRLSAIGGSDKIIKPTHGVVFRGAVAVFADGTPTAEESNFTAVISWGDGSKSSGSVTGSAGGPFTVSGQHTYAAAGTFKTEATLTDTVDNSVYTAAAGKAEVQ